MENFNYTFHFFCNLFCVYSCGVFAFSFFFQFWIENLDILFLYNGGLKSSVVMCLPPRLPALDLFANRPPCACTALPLGGVPSV